ncbi:MAG: DUF2225 domain-containing protein [Thermotogae bacterium]|nr:DUF2225 domain-containing protein [Thermotogota bacterium]
MVEKKDFWLKKMTCPLCGSEFESVRVASWAIKLKEREEDLRPVYVGVNPLYYSLITCDRCYYTAYEADFDNVFDITDMEKIKAFLSKVRSRFKLNLSDKRTVDDAILLYDLALNLYRFRKKGELKIADIYLKLGWLYREKGNHELELASLAKAIVAFEKLYDEGKINKVSGPGEVGVMYLIGALYDELDKPKTALEWFMRAVNYARKTHSSSPYAKMAKERWEGIKADMKEGIYHRDTEKTEHVVHEP